MSRTVINVSAVIEALRQIDLAKANVSDAKNSFIQTKNSVDGKIQSRANIRDRLNNVQRQLSNIDSKIWKIRSTVQYGANQYRTTDDKVQSMRKQVNASISDSSVRAQFGRWSGRFEDKIETDPLNNRSNVNDQRSFKSFLDLITNITKCIGKYGKSEKRILYVH